MALRVSLPEEHCRYLFSPGKGPSTYTWRALLASLGLEIPEEIGLDGLVARGWLKPLMRIKLPRTFYSNWISFPTYPVTGRSRPEDEWARDLWSLCTFSLSTSRTVSEGRLLGKWYRHVLDQPHDPLTRQVKPHLLATGPDNTEPPPISHRRFGRVSPWVDLFAYWQAYQLADVLSIIQRRIVLLYGTDQRPLLKQYLRSNARRDELVEKRLGRMRERWELNARVFDWISRYRTLRELWLTLWQSQRQPAWEEHDKACRKLQTDLNLTENEVETGIQNVLLDLWSRWSGPRGSKSLLLSLLQQDIVRALEFHHAITGREIDPLALPWSYPGRRSGPRPSLLEVLPYESWVARARLPAQAGAYLERYNEVVPEKQRLDREAIAEVIGENWARSAPLRRFWRTFHRLQEHYSGGVNAENLVGLYDQTPVEFLNLAALQAERLLAEAQSPGTHAGAPAPGFKTLLFASAEMASRTYSVKEAGRLVAELRGAYRSTDLRNLPATKRNPFREEKDFYHPEKCARFLLMVFFNYAVARNYAAHHDCLDEELRGSRLGGAAAEAALVVVLATLLAKQRE